MNQAIMLKIFAVAAAGALGALSRWGVTRAVHLSLGSTFEQFYFWGTLTVNVLGCFLFGLAIEFFRERFPEDEHLRFVITTGFLGAFTTFSTFAHETLDLLHLPQGLAWAAGNVVLSIALGLLAVAAGMALGRAL